MHPALKKYDDFEIVSRDLSEEAGFTLSALLHNEMHFLPPFLDHYRELGVERFVFVDDRSVDGTGDFLASQSDVMVLRSKRKYGDKIDAQDAAALGLSHQRLELVWRMLLVQKYALNNWSLHLDADEFLDLPEGMRITNLTEKLDLDDADAVLAVMIDMYPATISDLADMAEDAVIDLSASWYFDGERHLQLRQNDVPLNTYAGCRARLLGRYQLGRKNALLRTRLKRLLGLPAPAYNSVRKPILIRARDGMRFDSAHAVSLGTSASVLLPLRHYKFTGPIHQRIATALTTGHYHSGGRTYRDLAELLAAMSKGGGDFRYAKSVLHRDFEDFRRTGNAVGIE